MIIISNQLGTVNKPRGQMSGGRRKGLFQMTKILKNSFYSKSVQYMEGVKIVLNSVHVVYTPISPYCVYPLRFSVAIYYIFHDLLNGSMEIVVLNSADSQCYKMVNLRH